jgi:hypothetical protein
LIAGGESANGTVLATAEVYDPVKKTFTALGSMNTPRVLHAATLITSGSHKGWVLLAGGVDNLGNSLGSAEFFDPKKGRFVATGSMYVPRSSSGGAAIGSE